MKNLKTQRRNFTDIWNRPGYLVRQLHQIHVALFLDECREFNVTPVQFAVLTVLSNNQALDQITIANQMGADRNTVGDVVRRLEERGLIERPENKKDKRAKLAKITKKGLSFVNSVQPGMIKAQRQFTNALTREENALFIELMMKLIIANNESSRAPVKPIPELPVTLNLGKEKISASHSVNWKPIDPDPD